MVKRVLIVGGGFGGLEAAKKLGNQPNIQVTLIDRRNHHLFQPLLYQVSMAGLSPADIASPIRSILKRYKNIDVILGEVLSVDVAAKQATTDFGVIHYDYLILATGASHSYFGKNAWEPYAPGLKSIEQATEIRRRVFRAFELAEREHDKTLQRKYLTFVVIGAGPTGVELAGALGEITRFTLGNDFRHINPSQARIILVEAGDRVLAAFDSKLSQRAARDLEAMGVQIWLSSRVTNVTPDGVQIGSEFVEASTVLWAAGVEASPLGKGLGAATDRSGRVIVNPDLTIEGHKDCFVIGDLANARDHSNGSILPGLAPVAMQQGRYVARVIKQEVKQQSSVESKLRADGFRYADKGMMATIGRSKAVMQFKGIRAGGLIAWFAWMVVHIWYLIGFRSKVLVYLQWVWSFFSYKRGARLIVDKTWQFYENKNS